MALVGGECASDEMIMVPIELMDPSASCDYVTMFETCVHNNTLLFPSDVFDQIHFVSVLCGNFLRWFSEEMVIVALSTKPMVKKYATGWKRVKSGEEVFGEYPFVVNDVNVSIGDERYLLTTVPILIDLLKKDFLNRQIRLLIIADAQKAVKKNNQCQLLHQLQLNPRALSSDFLRVVSICAAQSFPAVEANVSKLVKNIFAEKVLMLDDFATPDSEHVTICHEDDNPRSPRNILTNLLKGPADRLKLQGVLSFQDIRSLTKHEILETKHRIERNRHDYPSDKICQISIDLSICCTICEAIERLILHGFETMRVFLMDDVIGRGEKASSQSIAFLRKFVDQLKSSFEGDECNLDENQARLQRIIASHFESNDQSAKVAVLLPNPSKHFEPLHKMLSAHFCVGKADEFNISAHNVLLKQGVEKFQPNKFELLIFYDADPKMVEKIRVKLKAQRLVVFSSHDEQRNALNASSMSREGGRKKQQPAAIAALNLPEPTSRMFSILKRCVPAVCNNSPSTAVVACTGSTKARAPNKTVSLNRKAVKNAVPFLQCDNRSAVVSAKQSSMTDCLINSRFEYPYENDVVAVVADVELNGLFEGVRKRSDSGEKAGIARCMAAGKDWAAGSFKEAMDKYYNNRRENLKYLRGDEADIIVDRLTPPHVVPPPLLYNESRCIFSDDPSSAVTPSPPSKSKAADSTLIGLTGALRCVEDDPRDLTFDYVDWEAFDQLPAAEAHDNAEIISIMSSPAVAEKICRYSTPQRSETCNGAAVKEPAVVVTASGGDELSSILRPSRRRKRKRNPFILTQASKSGSEHSADETGDELDEADEEMLKFIDDNVADADSEGNSFVHNRMPTQMPSPTLGEVIPRPLKPFNPNDVYSQWPTATQMNDDYVMDSFCVADDVVYFEGDDESESSPEKRPVMRLRKKRVITVLSSSEDEASPITTSRLDASSTHRDNSSIISMKSASKSTTCVVDAKGETSVVIIANSRMTKQAITAFFDKSIRVFKARLEQPISFVLSSRSAIVLSDQLSDSLLQQVANVAPHYESLFVVYRERITSIQSTTIFSLNESNKSVRFMLVHSVSENDSAAVADIVARVLKRDEAILFSLAKTKQLRFFDIYGRGPACLRLTEGSEQHKQIRDIFLSTI